VEYSCVTKLLLDNSRHIHITLMSWIDY